MNYREPSPRPWTSIPNAVLEDIQLSWKARGMLCYILSRPNYWEFNLKDLCKLSAKDAETAVKSAFKELVGAGYARLEYKRSEDGRHAKGKNYAVSDVPKRDSQETSLSGNLTVRKPPCHDAYIEGIDKRVSDPGVNQDLGLTQREESIDKNLCYPGARNASVSPPGHHLQSNGLATPALGGKIKPLAEDDWLRALLLDYEQLDFRYLNDDGWWIDVSQPLGAVFEKEWLNSEFGKISAYLRENPKKKPASSQGWKRFIRSWLHRGYEQQRRMTRGNTQQPTTKRY